MEPAVSLGGIWKRYFRLRSRPAMFFGWLGYEASHGFWALQDVNLDLFPGDRMAIIGRNGAGKTTLLRVMSGLIRPTKGERRVRGRVLAVSEVQAGMNRELSGRENLGFLGLLAGIPSRSLRSRIDAIIAFAGVEEDALDAPVKNYSSGMAMRLGLSVALEGEPDVLLLDEGLVSGDAEFRARVRIRLDDMLAQGTAQVFVSHENDDIKTMCNKLAYLRAGRMEAFGDPDRVMAAYRAEIAARLAGQARP
jgi:ABC-type polysaccharide/polyol phosphate transport system ATPase subunit